MLKSSAPPVIRLRGVRQNNLKEFDLDLPLNQLIEINVLTEPKSFSFWGAAKVCVAEGNAASHGMAQMLPWVSVTVLPGAIRLVV